MKVWVRLTELEAEMSSRKIDFSWEDAGFGLRAAGVMLDGKGRVLLCRVANDPELDFWVLPGGGCMLHETSIETVEREFLEEANFEVEVQRLLWIQEYYFMHEGRKIHGVGFYYLVSPKETNGVWEQDEFLGQEDDFAPNRILKLAFKWFDPSELEALELYPIHFKKALQNIPKHPVHVINREYEDSLSGG